MLVQVNTDHNIEGTEAMHRHFEETVKKILARFEEDVTRVEIRIKDVNAGKEGTPDKHCTLEARVKGLEPMVASNDATDLHDAVKGAAEKMKALLTKMYDKRKAH